MTLVAGLAASLLRKFCTVVGVMVLSAEMVLYPEVAVPLTWLFPCTVSCLATVSKPLSTFCS